MVLKKRSVSVVLRSLPVCNGWVGLELGCLRQLWGRNLLLGVQVSRRRRKPRQVCTIPNDQTEHF